LWISWRVHGGRYKRIESTKEVVQRG
jgi:hypothetical protein